jgi:hypothetical protein
LLEKKKCNDLLLAAMQGRHPLMDPGAGLEKGLRWGVMEIFQ